MKNYISMGLLWIIFALCIIICIGSFFLKNAKADNSILDEKIEKFCYEHMGSKYENFGEFGKSNGFRCTAILQAIYRFETGHLKSYQGNNIFNFKSPTCKKEWVDNYGCKVKNGFLQFPDKTKGIQFAVDRFYNYEVYKTISQIIAGGYYCSPVTGWCGYINGYTHTKSDQPYYIDYVKKYFNNLKLGRKG